MKEIVFENAPNQPLKLYAYHNVFVPNTTTKLLINSVLSIVSSKKKILDLGCGTGAVGISLFKEGIISDKIYASDLSLEAAKCCEKNIKSYKFDSDIRTGSMFEPWINEKFDIVIDDISAISEDVANISPWFPGVPCKTGKDGTDLVSKIITDAKKYLKSDSSLFFFPVLSLSNVEQILSLTRKKFNYVELIKRKTWPLPADLMPHIDLLEKLENENAIKFERKFGMIICNTEVYCASDQKFIKD